MVTTTSRVEQPRCHGCRWRSKRERECVCVYVREREGEEEEERETRDGQYINNALSPKKNQKKLYIFMYLFWLAMA